MTRWHADLDMQTLAPGATVTVSSHHQVVRMIIADTLSIQFPDGQRFSALVMGREPGRMDLVLHDGHICSLDIALDQSFPSPREAIGVFSRQTWVVH